MNPPTDTYAIWVREAERVAPFLSSRIENIRGLPPDLVTRERVHALRAEVTRAQRRKREGRAPLHPDLA